MTAVGLEQGIVRPGPYHTAWPGVRPGFSTPRSTRQDSRATSSTSAAPPFGACRAKLIVELKLRINVDGAAMCIPSLVVAASLLLANQALAQVRDDSMCRPTLGTSLGGPQVADLSFNPRLPPPAFAMGQGLHVLLDEAHFNFHTVDGRYAPFAKILTRDGYVVDPLRDRFTRASLASARILVVANAMSERNKDGDWTLPTPSAFARPEIEAVRQWVMEGGSLFLIADHMPFGGAAADLASAFGIYMTNGFATDRTCSALELVFLRADGSLMDHPITRGRNASERIDSIRTFTGQSFRVAPGVQTLLVLAPETVLLLPSEAWKFSDATPRMAADGMFQGATRIFGRGRVAVFGEAAMFSAQVFGPQRQAMGMNAMNAPRNAQFLLNVMHWLSGLIPAR